MLEKKVKKPKNYINNADLLKELEISNKQNKMTNNLANMFYELTTRYAKVPRFVNYTYNDDMKSFALLILTNVWRTFDATRSQNPFAYFTQTIKRAFFQFDNMERKQRDIRDALLVDGGQNPSFSYAQRNVDNYDEYIFNPDSFDLTTANNSSSENLFNEAETVSEIKTEEFLDIGTDD
jgi:hypothetical protein